MSTTTTPAPVNVKFTKTAVIGFLGIASAIVANLLGANTNYTFLVGLIGAALGDSITFLMGNTLSDKWTYASVNLLLSAILATVGTFVGQAVAAYVKANPSASGAAPMLGAVIGYLIAYAITLLDQSASPPVATPTPPLATPISPA